MSLIPCDFCHKRVQEKLSQATWAWYAPDGTRVAYRQRLCTTCYCTNVLPLDEPTDFDALRCPACSISTEHDMEPIYATVFVPGAGREQFEFPTCGSCAVEIKARAQEGAARLENRGSVEGPGGGPSTAPARDSYWAGIVVRQPRDPA